jgi:hypothetical protein
MGTIGDLKNLGRHFSQMAEKGWMIDKIGLFYLRYRAAKPSKKHFYIDLFLQATLFDRAASQDAGGYRHASEGEGWKFVVATNQFRVYCADGEVAEEAPVYNDNQAQAHLYLKACRRHELQMFAICLLMSYFFVPYGRGAELYESKLLLFQLIGYLIFLVGYVWTAGFALLWYWRSKKAAEQGLTLPEANLRWTLLRSQIFALCLVALFVCFVAGIVLEMARYGTI